LNLKHFILIACFFLSLFSAFGQQKDTTQYDTPIRKGRWIAVLNGVINSGTVIRPDSTLTNKKFSNNYSFSVSGYGVIIDRLAVGIVFTITRTGSEEIFIKESEAFNIGPSIRYYLATQKQGGPFLQTGVIYSRFYDRIALLDVQSPIDRVLRGRGPGFMLGLGYDYVFKDILSLGIGFNLTHAWLSGDNVDQINNTSEGTNFRRFSFSFSFGLGILIGKQQ
jgi:hypothetical protein